jgi:hypothetical protein
MCASSIEPRHLDLNRLPPLETNTQGRSFYGRRNEILIHRTNRIKQISVCRGTASCWQPLRRKSADEAASRAVINLFQIRNKFEMKEWHGI